MPKVGLTDNEWRARLRDYAAGKLKFSKGQHPSRRRSGQRPRKRLTSAHLIISIYFAARSTAIAAITR